MGRGGGCRRFAVARLQIGNGPIVFAHRMAMRLSMHGFDALQSMTEARRMIYEGAQRQAMMVSFVDNFRVMSVLCVAMIPLMFVMKKARARKGERVSAH